MPRHEVLGLMGHAIAGLGTGQHLKTSSALLLLLGIATAVFGLLPGKTFFIRLHGLHTTREKSVPRWEGRLWFLLGGALLIYWA